MNKCVICGESPARQEWLAQPICKNCVGKAADKAGYATQRRVGSTYSIEHHQSILDQMVEEGLEERMLDNLFTSMEEGHG